jgi:hypothetical protein
VQRGAAVVTAASTCIEAKVQHQLHRPGVTAFGGDWLPGSVNPPLASEPKTPLPQAMPATVSAMVPAVTSHRNLVTFRPQRVNNIMGSLS